MKDVHDFFLALFFLKPVIVSVKESVKKVYSKKRKEKKRN